MKKQKIISQTKGQDKIPEKQLNEVGIGNLPEKEFRITIVKMIQDLRKSMEKMQDAYQRPRRTKEKTEMNNTLERINSRITEAVISTILSSRSFIRSSASVSLLLILSSVLFISVFS